MKIVFLGEVFGTYLKNNEEYAKSGDLVKFTLGNIIDNDGDNRVKISTNTYNGCYGKTVELWVTNIELLNNSL